MRNPVRITPEQLAEGKEDGTLKPAVSGTIAKSGKSAHPPPGASWASRRGTGSPGIQQHGVFVRRLDGVHTGHNGWSESTGPIDCRLEALTGSQDEESIRILTRPGRSLPKTPLRVEAGPDRHSDPRDPRSTSVLRQISGRPSIRPNGTADSLGTPPEGVPPPRRCRGSDPASDG